MPTRRDYAAIAEQAVASNRPLQALEFHPAAVAALDAFIDLTWGEEGMAKGDDRWQPTGGKGPIILSFGAFLGELVRRQFGGEWREDPVQPENVLAAHVVLGGGHRFFAIAKVYRRLRDGAQERLEPFYLRLREQLGAPPAGEEADGWVRQARHFDGASRPDLAGRFYDRALALSPAPAKRAEIEGLRAAAAAAVRAAQVEERDRALAESRARLAGLAEKGRGTLAGFGVRVEHGALTIFGLDTFLDETLGRGAVPEERRRPDLEDALGAFLGELLCARYRGRWREQPVEALTRSQVVWPSGLAACPFEILRKRLSRGAPSVL
jgi:hypothetical protein